MEKYDAIYKCINDKLRDDEILLEHYREEKSKDEKRILELEEEVDRLMKACIDLTEQKAQLEKANEFLKNKVYGGKKK